MDDVALEHVALGPGRDTNDRKSFASVECRMRLAQVCRADRNAHRSARIEGLYDPAAELTLVAVDDRDRNLAQDLVEVRLRVIDAVDQWPDHQQDEGAAQRKDARRTYSFRAPEIRLRRSRRPARPLDRSDQARSRDRAPGTAAARPTPDSRSGTATRQR